MKKLLLVLFVGSTLMAQAQFSELDQLYPFVVSTIYNPANTGNFIDDRYGNDYTTARFQSNTAIERIRRNPYLTTVGSVDGRLNVGRKDYIGIGGDYEYRTILDGFHNGHLLNIRGNYQKRIGGISHVKETILSLGIGAGVYQNNSKISSNWAYRQQHGLSFRHITKKRAIYQIGISHSMFTNLAQFINGKRDSAVSSSWMHLIGMEAYGEWCFSPKWAINTTLVYNQRLETFGGLVPRHSLGGTVGIQYALGNQNKCKLVLGIGTQFILWNQQEEVARMIHSCFGGFEYQGFRLLLRVSNNYSNGLFYGYSFESYHHVGVSMAYFILKKPRFFLHPTW